MEASKATYDRVPTAFSVGLQRFMGWLFLQPFCGLLVLMLRTVGGYRIENLRELRKYYRELANDPRPLLVCPNHLTFIDSALTIWAFGSMPWYQFRFSRFSWNLPAGDFFKKKLSYRIVAYLTKCLFIHRDGTARHKSAVLDLCMQLLRKGDVVTIFPEGKRSRTGRFETDRLTFGVGKTCLNVPGCRVLCIYIRSDQQEGYSSYPPRGSNFRVMYKLIEPKTLLKGREAYYDLTLQIAREIKMMEIDWFRRRGIPITIPSPGAIPIAVGVGAPVPAFADLPQSPPNPAVGPPTERV